MHDLRRHIALIETAQHPDVERVREIATRYRQEMESTGWLDSRSGGLLGDPEYSGHYGSFAGECELHAYGLAQRLRTDGFAAFVADGEYVVDDPQYYDLNERLEWETHFYVIVGRFQDPDALVADVTADQFHPSDPQAYRVVVTTRRDPHYR